MKLCPKCRLSYADDTLRFCLEDGTVLIDDVTAASDKTLVMDSTSSGEEPPPTQVLPFGPPPTVRSYDDEATALRIKPGATARQQARPTLNEFDNAAAPSPVARKTSSVVAITAVATILVLAAGGFGAWLLMRDKTGSDGGGSNTRTENTEIVTNSNVTNRNGSGNTGGNTNSFPSPTPTTTPEATPTATPQPTPTSDSSTARSEVMAALNGWTESMRRADLEEHMARYASVLHTYYNARNYGVSGVRANVAKAFSRYSSFDVRLTNIQIEVDPSGTKAVASFTKSYVFSGPGRYAGSGLNRFWFEKIGGRWLITGEKDFG